MEKQRTGAGGPQTWTRRGVVHGSLAVPDWAAGLKPAAAQALQSTEARQADFADVILPRAITPSASDLGSHRRILRRAGTDPRFASIVTAALDLMDRVSQQSHGRDFVSASPATQVAIVTGMSEAPEDTLPGWFFRAARAELFMDYYARPESWTGLGIEGPPQPVGHLDATAAPVDRT